MGQTFSVRPKILERDVDTIIVRRLREDAVFTRAFIQYLANQLGPALEYDQIRVETQVPHAGSAGTIDIAATLCLQGSRECGRLLIEDKLDSTFTPSQPERYAATAFAHSAPGRPAFAVLCAPVGYLIRSRYIGAFSAKIAYEKLIDWLDGTDRKIIEAAIARFEMPYEPDPVPAVAEFFQGYQELLSEYAPELILKGNPNTNAVRPAGSYTIYFDARRTLPAYSFLPSMSFSHQCQDKQAPSPSVKILFRTWARYQRELSSLAATDLAGTGLYIRAAGESLGLVCNTPRLDNRRLVGEQIDAVRTGIRSASKLRAWIYENENVLSGWAKKVALCNLAP